MRCRFCNEDVEEDKVKVFDATLGIVCSKPECFSSYQRESYSLKKNSSLFAKIAKTPSVVKSAVEMLNSLCLKCRRKLLKNPTMDPDNCCPECRDKALANMREAKEKLK